ncbi:unnamed protein product, partial [Meganyctiphanes norvegica]
MSDQPREKFSIMADGGEEFVIRIRGLPWSASVDDIVEFFSEVEILEGRDGVHMTMSREGRPSGEAYVELVSQDDIEEAEKKHKCNMGKRYIEVFRAKRSEMEWVTKRAGYSSRGQDNDGCVRLRGLPYQCTKEEIANFFSSLEVCPNGIAMPMDYQGRPSGEAYVQFTSQEISDKALERHKEKIGVRYIEVFRSSLDEIRAAMNPRGGMDRGGPGPMGGPRGGYRNSPYDARDRYGGMNRGGGGGGGGGGYNDGPGWGGQSYGGGGSWGGPRGGPGIGGGGPGWDGPGRHSVHMRGLPFRATEMDIADFFRPLNPVNISLGTEPNGRASGKADVEFATHEDAVEAMKKDKTNMQHRYIELFLNSTPGGPSVGRGGPGMGGGFGGMGGGYNDDVPGPRGGYGERMGGGSFSNGGGMGGGYGGRGADSFAKGDGIGSFGGGGGGGGGRFGNNQMRGRRLGEMGFVAGGEVGGSDGSGGHWTI